MATNITVAIKQELRELRVQRKELDARIAALNQALTVLNGQPTRVHAIGAARATHTPLSVRMRKVHDALAAHNRPLKRGELCATTGMTASQVATALQALRAQDQARPTSHHRGAPWELCERTTTVRPGEGVSKGRRA